MPKVLKSSRMKPHMESTKSVKHPSKESTLWNCKGTEAFSSVQSLSHVRLFVTPWTTARQASLSITDTQSLFKLISIELVMPSNHLILCRPLLLLPSVFSSLRIFSNESALHIRWPKYWSFSFNNSPSNEHLGLISLWDGLVGSSCSSRDSQESSPTPQLKATILWHSAFFIVQFSHPSEKALVTYSSTLAWKIPWMEKSGRLQSMGSLRVGHD